jgi:hypothetical protein
MAAKHFNRGNVWGRVVKATLEEKGRFLQLKIDCSSPKYGKVATYGRIWGKSRIKPLQDYLKKNAGALIRFTGFFQQYEKDGRHYSNYTFYEWSPAPDKEPRAAFILVGDLKYEGLDEKGDTRLLVELLREGIEDRMPVEESFELYAMSETLLEGILEGDTIETKGIIRPKAAEDEYGGSGGEIRAYVMEISKREQKEGGAAA